MPDEAARVLTLLQRVTSTLCVACLANVTAVPLPAMRITTADLLGAGRLMWAPEHPCQNVRQVAVPQGEGRRFDAER